jgi:mutator protein MutT
LFAKLQHVAVVFRGQLISTIGYPQQLGDFQATGQEQESAMESEIAQRYHIRFVPEEHRGDIQRSHGKTVTEPNSMDPIKVVGAIFRDGKKFMVAQRSTGHLAGKWEFPGGKIEDGESPQASLKRELAEELGVDATIGDFVASTEHDYGKVKIDLACYLVDNFQGTLRPKDHSQIKWVHPDELLDVDLAPADIPIARALLALGP